MDIANQVAMLRREIEAQKAFQGTISQNMYKNIYNTTVQITGQKKGVIINLSTNGEYTPLGVCHIKCSRNDIMLNVREATQQGVGQVSWIIGQFYIGNASPSYPITVDVQIIANVEGSISWTEYQEN